MSNEIIGERLQNIRKASGFSQEQVAKYLGINRVGLSYIETGARPVSTTMLQKLADLYGYRYSYFFSEDTEGTENPQVATAFRIVDIDENDLEVISQVKRIATNLDKLYNMLGVRSGE